MGFGLEAPEATGEVCAVVDGVFCRRLSSLEIASASTAGSTGACSPLSTVLFWFAGGGSVVGVISVMSEFGPKGLSGGDLVLWAFAGADGGGILMVE